MLKLRIVCFINKPFCGNIHNVQIKIGTYKIKKMKSYNDLILKVVVLMILKLKIIKTYCFIQI